MCLNWRAVTPTGRATKRIMTKMRTGVMKIGRYFLPDPESTSAQESKRQVYAPCVEALLSLTALCASNTGDKIILTRT
jgi:hypothetical protein